MCPDCERMEIAFATACWAAENEAADRGEAFDCTCPRVVCTHAAPEPPAPDDLCFTCRCCGKRWGDFFYCATEDCCAECAGVEFPP